MEQLSKRVSMHRQRMPTDRERGADDDETFVYHICLVIASAVQSSRSLPWFDAEVPLDDSSS
jgi:hypothetical protein